MFSTSIGEGIQLPTDYSWQKFSEALRCAVSSTAPLQERLADLAWEVANLRREDFPDPDTWSLFEGFMTATAGRTTKINRKAIVATTSQMSDEEAGKWLQEAIKIFSNLSEES